MNKKIVVRRDDGKIMHCILPSAANMQGQFNLFLFGEEYPTGGYSAIFYDKTIEIADRISFDTVTTFDILLHEDTEEPTTKSWVYHD